MLTRKDIHSYVVSGFSRTRPRTLACGLVMIAALTGAACDKAQLLAPTQSTITASAPTSVLPSGGSTEISAFVMENSGTPVQNGTTVRFIPSLGRVDPVEAQTRNGVAVTTFFAGDSSGIATIRASSGAATGGEGTTLNVVTITIGAAAVTVVTIRANPASVGPAGGSVELIATVVGKEGQTLPGVLVTFTTTQGSLSSSTATTNAGGEARTTLVTSEAASVTATAGIITSAAAAIAVRPGPVVTITCTPASGGTSCAAVQASTSNNTATVTFIIAKPAGSSALRTATLDFGDGASQGLGNLVTGTTTVTHTYSGPSSPGTQSYAAIVSATDVNGESASVSTPVIITRPTPTPINVNVSGTSEAATAQGQRWTLTATASGGGEGTTPNAPIESYTWDFGDGETIQTSSNVTSHVYRTLPANPQRRTVTVTVRTVDGRTATGRTEILVSGFS